MAGSDSKKDEDWVIRSQVPKSAITKDTEKVQRLDGNGFEGA